jgi:hypothetical protein
MVPQNADTVTMDRWSLLRKVGGGVYKESAAVKDEGIALPC